ncbi:MAG: type III-A CRISPR-associated protein Cas10/Csm1 [Sphingomonadaceae bacterium]
MPTQDAELQAVQLGALLHDVGKLFLRSGLRHSPGYDAFSEDDYGAHGAHAKWSADFVEHHVANRWPLRPHDLLTHHLPLPPSRAARLIALADRMAAGERVKDDEKRDRRPPEETQLLSIFSRLQTSQNRPGGDGYYPLTPLALDRAAIFPRPERLSPEECRSGYLRLWQGFEAEFSRLRQSDFDRYLEAAFHLLQRYGWCVPSAVYHQTPDVSLFDHSRLTCAIATCLYLDAPDDSRLEALLAWPKRPERADPLLLLVGGDLSGLQEFLYRIAAKGAAKTLRGRSLYLQLLMESAARYLLRRLSLATPSILYCGGGHFYLLAPLSAAATLEEAAAEVEERMLEIHGGELGLAVGHIPLSMLDFEGERFAAKWGEVGTAVNAAKTRRFGRILHRAYDRIFTPWGSGGESKPCEACHADLPSGSAERTRCPACEGMVDLGEQIAEAAASGQALLSVGARRPPGTVSWWQEALGSFGCWWEFGSGSDGAIRYTLNDTGFVAAGADGFRWIPAVVPRIEKDGREGTKEFEDIARDAQGIPRLGILRMDVDNLGSLFASSLGQTATASRVASLSSALRIFFEGWINRLCREVEGDTRTGLPGSGRRVGLFYGVYSGGDDLFVVGAWDRIPLLARRIRADLETFAVGNPGVSISAGIAIVDYHLPIHRGAEMAGDALENGSKAHRRGNRREKDAVTLLGETLGWEEFDSVLDRVAELARLVGEGAGGGRLPRSLLSLLGGIHALFRREALAQTGDERLDSERLYYGRWMWMAAYGLERARERAREEEAKLAVAAMRKRLSEPATIHRLGLVTRWAEYLTRSKEVEKG